MKNEIQNVLRNDFMSFTCKAIRGLDGTIISKDRYLEYLTNKLMEFADGKNKRLIINLPPRHLKTLLGSVCSCRLDFGAQPQ